jgi:site-specific DNA recombinase
MFGQHTLFKRCLKNEKYKGCTAFQKTYTNDFISGKRKINHGERTKYYVEDTHTAIVSNDIFDRVAGGYETTRKNCS